MKAALIFTALAFLSVAAADLPPQKGPPGGKEIENPSRPVEVKLGPLKDDKGRNIDVYVLNQPKMNPQSGSVKIYTGPDDVNPIVLQSVPMKDPGDPSPHYQGYISPGDQNNVGISIGLPLPEDGKEEVISSREQISGLGVEKSRTP